MFGESRARVLRGSREASARFVRPIVASARLLQSFCVHPARALRGCCAGPARPHEKLLLSPLHGFLRGPFEGSASFGELPTKPVHGFFQ